MIDDRYRWMKWLSDPIRREDRKVKNRGLGDDSYSLSIQPVSLVIGGQPWAFASDGAASLLVRGEVEWKSPSDMQAAIIHGFVTADIRGRLNDFSAFRRWLGRGWASRLPCESCHGDWAKNCAACFGIGQVGAKCPHCAEAHDCTCRRCGGSGALYCPTCVGAQGFSRRPGQYRGVFFDRCLLARFLSHVECEPTTRVRIMVDHQVGPVWVEHEDRRWRVAVMPIRAPESDRASEWAGE